ncbi:MAG: hypothetical protein QM756_23595 [Polyangiaceae bacterium]
MRALPGGREIPVLGGIGPLLVLDALHQLGNEEIQVQVAVAVAVGGQVDGHAVDGDGKVGAVVQVEAPQEILVGFAVPGMLGDDEAGYRFQHLRRAQQGAVLQLPGRHRADAGGIGDADQVLGAGPHLHHLQGGHAGGQGLERQCQGGSRQGSGEEGAPHGGLEAAGSVVVACDGFFIFHIPG